MLPEASDVELGDTEMLITGTGGTTVTYALALWLESASLFAVMVTLLLLVTVGGVNRPELDIIPALEDQLTAVLLVHWTVAENCWVPPEATLALVGETTTVIELT